MAPKSGSPRLKVLSVGGNPVSAFLSWRLQATNACDVTLVWKSGYDHVAQYGISFKSQSFGNERFKPRRVVRNPEDATGAKEGPFDYVVLCVKALPDLYDIAAIIDSVVTPQHTCILINTTQTLGIETTIEERFPSNVVLSLVCGAELTQLGQSEFEHKGSTKMWIGPANNNSNTQAIQEAMAQALCMTLNTGQVECTMSSNIRQQQYERVIGPIAFHPVSVIFDTPNHAALLEKVGVREMINDVIDELLLLAEQNGCKFSPDFKRKTIEDMSDTTQSESIMWQDYIARRPMEVETYLGSPIKLAREKKVPIPRIETLYSILHHLNIVNRNRPKSGEGPNGGAGSPTMSSPVPRMPSRNGHRPMGSSMGGPMPPNGNGMPGPRQQRPRNSSNLGQGGPPGMPPGMRRGPPSGMNGGPPNGYGRGPPPSHMNGPPNMGQPHMNGAPSMNGGSRAPSRRGSMDGNDLEEFSHLMLYDNIPEGAESPRVDQADMALREREMQLRQREVALREQEMRMRRGGPPGPGPGPGPRGGYHGGPRGGPPRGGPHQRGPHPMRHSQQVFMDDDDDDDDFVDPMSGTGTPQMIDPDNFDMMSVTSRKNRKVNGSTSGPPPSKGSRFRPNFGRNNRSSQLAAPMMTDNILDDPLMSCSSNRYGAVDRGAMGAASSRANSLTASKLEELTYGQAPLGPPGPPSMSGAYPRNRQMVPQRDAHGW